MSGNVHRLPNRDAALKALYDDVSAKHMFPFWATSTDGGTRRGQAAPWRLQRRSRISGAARKTSSRSSIAQSNSSRWTIPNAARSSW